MSSVNLQLLMPDLIALARRAGDAILEVYEQDFSVTHKEDDSPLTQADLASHVIIRDALAALTPQSRCCPRNRPMSIFTPDPAGQNTGWWTRWMEPENSSTGTENSRSTLH